jgi:hypothetical protein
MQNLASKSLPFPPFSISQGPRSFAPTTIFGKLRRIGRLLRFELARARAAEARFAEAGGDRTASADQIKRELYL